MALALLMIALEQLSVAMSNGATPRDSYERDDGSSILDANNPHKTAIPRYSLAVQVED
jgi:hypothetical protein